MMGFGLMFMWVPVVLVILLAALLGKGSMCMSHSMEQHEESAREKYLQMKGEIEKQVEQ